jgi:hypothetical protein
MKTPKAPDPVKTAEAQSGLNRDTAITQQQLNMVNQVTPDGSLTYNQTGQSSFTDSKGQQVFTPTYTATQTLSPEQQALKAQTDAASLNIGKLANTQSGFLNKYLAKPFEYKTSDAENYAFELGRKRLDPMLARNKDQARTQLINSGIRPGTPAYDQAYRQLTEQQSDAYNQLALNSQSQGFNQALTERNQPLNEISALMSGSQIQSPQFTNTPSTGVAGVDYTGLVNQKYQSELQASQAKMGGLFGLLSGGIGLLSDRRAKRNITRVGVLDNGLPVYSYQYKGSNDWHIGLIADEVEKVKPEAVTIGSDGLSRVRYDIAVEKV